MDTGEVAKARPRRRAPAFMRYAADSQVAPQHRLSLAEHGLLALMRDCQWLSDDDTVPVDPAALAWLVRRPVEEVRAALPAVLGLRIFLASIEGALFDPQLRAYKAKVAALSDVRAKAGERGNEVKKGLKRKKNRRAPAIAFANANAPANASLTLTPTSTQSVGAGSIKDPFVEDYDRVQAEEERAGVSNVRRIAVGGGS